MPIKGQASRVSFIKFDSVDWMADPNPCKTENVDLFFPTGGGHEQQRAIAICYTCPNRLPCLDYALRTSVDHGIWGGITERGRRHMRRVRCEVA